MTQSRFCNLENCTFLLGVGAQKAGTTWLFRYLGNHPQILLSPIKELHYFDQLYRPGLYDGWYENLKTKLLRLAQTHGNDLEGFAEHAWPIIERLRMTRNQDAYLAYFDRIASGGAGIVGEITPSYSLIPEYGYREIQELLGRYIGKIKIIFIMRDPVDRFWSQLRHDVRKGRIISANDHVSAGLKQPFHLELSRYDVTITNLEKAFNPESIKYLFFESLFCDGTLSEICDFLGVDFSEPAPGFYQQKINWSESEPRSIETTIRIRNEFQPVYDFVFRKFGDSVPGRWHEIYSLPA